MESATVCQCYCICKCRCCDEVSSTSNIGFLLWSNRVCSRFLRGLKKALIETTTILTQWERDAKITALHCSASSLGGKSDRPRSLLKCSRRRKDFVLEAFASRSTTATRPICRTRRCSRCCSRPSRCCRGGACRNPLRFADDPALARRQRGSAMDASAGAVT